jgi:transcriptional regulator with XRE-family HTH domain
MEKEERGKVLRTLKSEAGADDAPHPIDRYVGGRIRLRRAQLGLSQSALAERIGVSFQAVQKYETGAIRISASRLYEASRALKVSPGFFFEDYPEAPEIGGDPLNAAGDDLGAALDRREILSLVRGYCGIRDPALQAEILRLVGRLGNREGAPESAS